MLTRQKSKALPSNVAKFEEESTQVISNPQTLSIQFGSVMISDNFATYNAITNNNNMVNEESNSTDEYIPLENLSKLIQIGEGEFGSVYKGM